MNVIKRLFSSPLSETSRGVFRPISLAAEMTPGVVITASFLPGAFYGQRYFIGMAAVSMLSAALRLIQLRKVGPDGIPLAAIEGDTLVFISRDLSRQFKRFPIAEIEQIRIYGSPGYRFFSFQLAGQPEMVIAPAFRLEREQAVLNFLQNALPGKVLVAPKPKTFFDRARGDCS